MKHATFSRDGAGPASVVASGGKSKRNGYIARLIVALYRSRRNQARLYLTAYRHLLADRDRIGATEDL